MALDQDSCFMLVGHTLAKCYSVSGSRENIPHKKTTATSLSEKCKNSTVF